MNERLCRARRILSVQVQIERLAQWRLIDRKSLVLALEDRRKDLLQLLQGESSFNPVFAAAAMRRLQTAAEELAKAMAEMDAQTARYLEERRLSLRAERTFEALRRDAERQEAAHNLAEAIELAALRKRKPAASL